MPPVLRKKHTNTPPSSDTSPHGPVGWSPWIRRWINLRNLGLAVLLWIVVATVWQGRWDGLWSVIVRLGLLVSVALCFTGLFAAGIQIFFPVCFYVLWYWFAGSPHLWWDLGLLTVIVMVATGSSAALWSRSRGTRLAYGVLTMVVVWGVLSTADLLLTPKSIGREPGAYAAVRARSPWPKARVGVALSGGGYRAALMHAGVLHGLEKMGLAPTHIAGVSGGAIIGSYYATGGRPERFLEAVTQGQFGLKRRLSNLFNAGRMMLCPGEIPGVGVRLLPFCSFGRSDVQAQILDAVLLDGVELADAQQTGLPKLMVGTTELAEGSGLGMEPAGMVLLSGTSLTHNFGFANTPDAGRFIVAVDDPSLRSMWGTQRLSRAVAASGAFPGALSAVSFQWNHVNLTLIDGGVTDNSAMGYLLTAASKSAILNNAWQIDVAIASDGAMPFGVYDPKTPDRAEASGFDQLSRALDVVSNNSGQFPELKDGLPVKLLLLSPRPLLAANGVDVERAAVERLWNQARHEAQSDPALRELMDAWLPELVASLSAAKGDRHAVPDVDEAGLGSLLRSLDQFAHSPTLVDTYRAHEALRLFQLGQFLVALHWTDIRAALDAGRTQTPD